MNPEINDKWNILITLTELVNGMTYTINFYSVKNKITFSFVCLFVLPMPTRGHERS